MNLQKAEFIIHVLIAALLAIVFGFAFLYQHELHLALTERRNEIPASELIRFINLFKWFVWIFGGFFLVYVALLIRLLVKRASPEFRLSITRWRLAKLVGRSYARVSSEWASYVVQGSQQIIWHIRTALAHEYAAQEKDDLTGEGDLIKRGWTKRRRTIARKRSREPEGRPLIITSFVRYSKLVKSMVRAIQRNADLDTSTVFCVTTLNMPLRKWFNFDERLDCIHEGWESYLNFLRNEVNSAQNVLFARVMLVRPDDSETRVNLRKRRELKAELKKWVWLTTETTPDSGGFGSTKLLPVHPRESSAILSALRENFSGNQYVQDRLNGLVKGDRPAYLIVDGAAFADDPPSIPQGQFVRLGTQFTLDFHSHTSGGYQAYYAEVDPKDYKPKWDLININNKPPHPLDMFFVSLIGKNQGTAISAFSQFGDVMNPLFCIGAEPPESGLYVSYLYLLDPERNPKINFPEIVAYLKSLMTKARPLSELMNEP